MCLWPTQKKKATRKNEILTGGKKVTKEEKKVGGEMLGRNQK